MDEFHGKILDKLAEITERSVRIETRLERIEEDVKDIKAEDSKQNQLLAEHIAGTVANTQRLNLEKDFRDSQFKTIDARLIVVEFLPGLLKHLWITVKWVGKVIAIAATVTTLYYSLK